jgi:hypothetical protein
MKNFTATDNSHISPVVLHVPHGGTLVPQHLRSTFLLSEEELLREVELMADLRTDQIANEAISALEVQPSVFMNNLSRLVVDPERFDCNADRVLLRPMQHVHAHICIQPVTHVQCQSCDVPFNILHSSKARSGPA